MRAAKSAMLMPNTTHHHDKPSPVEKNFVQPAGDQEVLLTDEDTIVHAFDTKPGKKRRTLKTLCALYKGNYGRLCVSALSLILRSTPDMFNSLLIANIVNTVIYKEGRALYTGLAINVTLLLITFLMNLPFDALFVKNSSKAIRSVEANLRSTLIRKLHMLSIGFFKHIQTGRLQSKVLRDVEAITDLSRHLINNVLYTFFNFAVAIVVTLNRNPRVMLLFLLLVPTNLVVMRLLRAKLQENNKKFRLEMETTSANVIESMELMTVTRAHGLENTQIEKMEAQFEQVAQDGHTLDRTNGMFSRSIWFTTRVIQIVCLLFNVYLALKGHILVGDITLYQGYFSTIVNSVSNLISLMPMLSKGLESVNSVGDLLLTQDIENNRHKLTPPRLKGSVTFQNVSFRYDDGDTDVLQDFDLDVKAGETIALVGASGCGKTTAINLIIGFGKATTGQILLDGMNINDFNLNKYRSQLAVVPQTPILFSGTIRDNITYGNENISDERVYEVIQQANLKELVDSLPKGIYTVVGVHGDTLSGGQRQRIAIARALIRDPSIVILDEATSALDTVSERMIQTAINNVAKGRTTFIVAHRLSTIRNADRIVVVDQGRVAEIGTFQELMDQKGIFYKLQTLQDE